MVSPLGVFGPEFRVLTELNTQEDQPSLHVRSVDAEGPPEHQGLLPRAGVRPSLSKHTFKTF